MYKLKLTYIVLSDDLSHLIDVYFLVPPHRWENVNTLAVNIARIQQYEMWRKTGITSKKPEFVDEKSNSMVHLTDDSGEDFLVDLVFSRKYELKLVEVVYDLPFSSFGL